MTKVEKKLMAEIELLKTRIAALEARPMGIMIVPSTPYAPPVTVPQWPVQPSFPYITCKSSSMTGPAETQKFYNQ